MKNIVLAGLLVALTTGASAEWTLNNDLSRLSFISIKKGDIAEVHHFERLAGAVDSSGNVKVSVQLASVETAVPIRNERMQSMLFETEVFPTAQITAKVDIDAVTGLRPGDSVVEDVEAQLRLHGASSVLTAQLRLLRLDEDSVMVISNRPLIVNAQDFALGKGVERLREVVGLPSISLAVPVSFIMVFDA